MPAILELLPLGLARGRRLIGGGAFERLDAAQLIGAERPFAPCRQAGCVPIELTQIRHFGVKVGIIRAVQPGAHPMGFEIPLFTSRAACRGEMWGTILRRTASSAISRPDHSVIGRPDSVGASQAIRTIWHTCVSVIWSGRPGRGSNRVALEGQFPNSNAAVIESRRQPLAGGIERQLAAGHRLIGRI